MSVQYLLDGYNAIHQSPQAARQPTIKEAREALVGYLERGHFCGSPKNQMTVVFDGQPGIYYPKKASAVRVVFSSEETADDLIKRIVEQEKNKKNLYVITDDRALQQSVRASGAKILRINDFFGRMSTAQNLSSAAKGSGSEKNISKITEYKINDELKKIWMKQ
jgi:predicted RNA-binding protein with PIN domain